MPRLLSYPQISRSLRGFGITILLFGFAVCTTAAPSVEHFAFEISGLRGDQAVSAGPTSLTTDPRTGELFALYSAQGSVVIYDRDGRHPFEFSTRDFIATTRQLVVTQNGDILVLGEIAGRSSIARFDFKGDFVHSWPVLDPETGQPTDVTGLAIDQDDALYVVRTKPCSLLKFSPSWDLISVAPLFAEFKQIERDTEQVGRVSIIDNKMVVPMPIAHQVACFNLDGSLNTLFGQAGGAPGLLSHPIDVAGDGAGGFVVLDKHRCAVLHFDATGKFLAEFAGLGRSPGWFYHPNAIVSNNNGQVIVAQGFRGRIQVFDLTPRSGETPGEHALAADSPPTNK